MLDLHPRTLRRNIWSGLMCASDQEIHDGMSFYPGANGLCRLLAKSYKMSVRQIAGIYAALSPMNGWDTNVANMIGILRFKEDAKVNTTGPNRIKALRIANGENPEDVLRGKKVTAFYKAISDLNDTMSIPVDRHLMCLALGSKITSNSILSSVIGNSDAYTKVESAYSYLGTREGIGNRLASIAWFVQRRLSHQRSMYHEMSPVCCGKPMHSHGNRFRCSVCFRTRVKQKSSRLLRIATGVKVDTPLPDRSTLRYDHRGRVRISLGQSHSLANSGGWQYLARFVVQYNTGEILRKDEHVHHSNGILSDCTSSNLEVWLDENHGRFHAKRQLLYMLRDRVGRFMPSYVPSYSEQVQTEEEIPF